MTGMKRSKLLGKSKLQGSNVQYREQSQLCIMYQKMALLCWTLEPSVLL